MWQAEIMAAFIISNQVEAVVQQDSERKSRRRSQSNSAPAQPGMPGAGAPPYRTDNM